MPLIRQAVKSFFGIPGTVALDVARSFDIGVSISFSNKGRVSFGEFEEKHGVRTRFGPKF